MLADDLHAIYLKLKLYYYLRIFRKMAEDPDDSLTALEVFCAEAIYGLGAPTLTELARFINVSQPNAAYKVVNLEKKGFVEKTRSTRDGRLVRLRVTDKFLRLYGTSERYVSILAKRIENKYPPQQVELFSSMLREISEDMMRELNAYLRNRAQLPEGVLPE
ncbi:MAG: MarR family transcriptional regulator [Saccharofermentanales bacterium]